MPADMKHVLCHGRSVDKLGASSKGSTRGAPMEKHMFERQMWKMRGAHCHCARAQMQWFLTLCIQFWTDLYNTGCACDDCQAKPL